MKVKTGTHVLAHGLGDGLGEHEAGDGAGQDVEQGVHEACAGGGLDGGAAGAAKGAGGWSTAATYLKSRQRFEAQTHGPWKWGSTPDPHPGNFWNIVKNAVVTNYEQINYI